MRILVVGEVLGPEVKRLEPGLRKQEIFLEHLPFVEPAKARIREGTSTPKINAAICALFASANEGVLGPFGINFHLFLRESALWGKVLPNLLVYRSTQLDEESWRLVSMLKNRSMARLVDCKGFSGEWDLTPAIKALLGTFPYRRPTRRAA